MKSKVVFLVDYLDNNCERTEKGEVIAVFPDTKPNLLGEAYIYSASEKYNWANPEYLEKCRLATPEEYAGLKRELEVEEWDFDILEGMPDFNKLKKNVLNFNVRLVINGLDNDEIDLPQEFTHKILLALNKGLNPTDYNIEVKVSSVENPDNGGLFYK